MSSASPSLKHRCFVCRKKALQAHSYYASLCALCGERYYRKRTATPPDLTGRAALVTGGRIGIGYATALYLLRAGAMVRVVTRFPRGATHLYAAEPDFAVWRDRLHLHGLDLSQINAVEAFTQWLVARETRLDLLVNNAAQTIRRPAAYYAPLYAQENPTLHLPPLLAPLLSETPPTIEPLPAPATDAPTVLTDEDVRYFPPGQWDAPGQPLDLRPHNSWLLRDTEVSAREIMEVHAVNAVAPFLLCSRLKPLLARTADIHGAAYIVNVTSQEGRFSSGDKSPRHPHTNMAKAALNMMTLTLAEEYARHRIYMNAVDPGWVSFQHPEPSRKKMQASGITPPFDLRDAALRVLDPLLTHLRGESPTFGNLFKDYQSVPW